MSKSFKTTTINNALKEIEENRYRQTEGTWLEKITVECAPLIAAWDVSEAWLWKDWPERQEYYQIKKDLGIDVVVRRSSDGKLIAIQCKSRKARKDGKAHSLALEEVSKFLNITNRELWAERWLVSFGNVKITNETVHALGIEPEKDIAQLNLELDLRNQLVMQEVHKDRTYSHSGAIQNGNKPIETRDCMQREAINTSVRLLREHAECFKVKQEQEGVEKPVGRARGRIILPCGTGKSRIALRIVEELTEPSQVSLVLCPSIALVSQLRREFLNHSRNLKGSKLKVMAVCSDQGVARDKELANDPTADLGQDSAADVQGFVTTDPNQIGNWMDKVTDDGDSFGVIFGTYQSSHKIAEALEKSNREFQVMIADEAHRTAGLKSVARLDKKIRDFTICHDDIRIPTKYRIYQTATPKVFNFEKKRVTQNEKFIVRDMADETVFGPELYRRSYTDAVHNGWLSDYQIIAIGVNDKEAYDKANEIASRKGSKLSTAQLMRGFVLALVMGGALRQKGAHIRSSINFMNRIAQSNAMAKCLASRIVRLWVKDRMQTEGLDYEPGQYKLQHLDARSNVKARDDAKASLMSATENNPFGILNVNIFSEGVDAPSLSAVGFLEARKSPVDVIQAVGRVMRRAENKEKGYIICPILIPPGVDAETWLRNSHKEDGWKELGQILVALRAHDSRIEVKLSELMQIYLPQRSEEDDTAQVSTLVAIGSDDHRTKVYIDKSQTGEVQTKLERILKENVQPKEVGFQQLAEEETSSADWEAERILSGKTLKDGSIALREGGIERDKPASGEIRGRVNIKKTKKLAGKMLNETAGRPIGKRGTQATKRPRDGREKQGFDFDKILKEVDEIEKMQISVNLLEKSGLAQNRAVRDVNILEDSIGEATRCLKDDELDACLDRFFNLHQLDAKTRKKQANGCTIASLLLMNAAMLHQRISAGRWLEGISGLDTIKNSTDALTKFYDQWGDIRAHDFLPVFEPAIKILRAVRDTGRLEGMNRALRHLAGEAERIAEHYADLGADHAGVLFNKVMGNQDSDGAFFTLPPAATLLAGLTLDVASPDADWRQTETWREHRTVDLACGSGTLIASILTEMKRRAKDQGADEERLDELQKLAVEKLIAGLDFNDVSLQLAAAQMISGNRDVRYEGMQLHKMPYGMSDEQEGHVAIGSLELLGQSKIVPPPDLGWDDEKLLSEQLQLERKAPLPKGALPAVKNVRIVIMNPPFTNRSKMGEKFPKPVQQMMRKRVDSHEKMLITADPEMKEFVDKNSIEPMFVALADRCLNPENGVLSMINSTIALTATSALRKRIVLAERFHIHTLLTCHLPNQINLSQNTAINESMIIAKRHEGKKPPTRIISLDRYPSDKHESEELSQLISKSVPSLLPNGWGEVSEWPTERIAAGDWSAVAFRSPQLAEAAATLANDKSIPRLSDQNLQPAATGRVLRGKFKSSNQTEPGSFPILKSKGADGQVRIKGSPDEHWIPKEPAPPKSLISGQEHPETTKMLEKAGHLLITAGQRTCSGRLTAVACEEQYVGNGWMPIPSISLEKAKAASVFLNSTLGRLQLMRNPGKTLEFPTYSAKETSNLRVPDLSNTAICQPLIDCWNDTADIVVPQFRVGDCEVRRLWDEAVAKALNWNIGELEELRKWLSDEPHVRGLGRNQYGA